MKAEESVPWWALVLQCRFQLARWTSDLVGQQGHLMQCLRSLRWRELALGAESSMFCAASIVLILGTWGVASAAITVEGAVTDMVDAIGDVLGRRVQERMKQ